MQTARATFRSAAHEAMAAAARLIGRNRFGMWLAIGAREAARVVVKYHCTEGTDPATNGELMLLRSVAPQVRTFIDVGANVGEWTAYLVDAMPPGGRGVLFEPGAGAMAQLRERFAHSPNTTAIELVDAAVGEEPGEFPFYEEPAAGHTSSLTPDFSLPGAVARTVRVTTLDAEAARYGLDQIDLLKVDVEGYDLLALRGGRRLLREQRVGIVQFEYSRPWVDVGSTLTAAYRLLEGAGYSVYLLRSDGLYEFDYRRMGEWFGYANFVAVAPSWRPRLESLFRGRF